MTPDPTALQRVWICTEGVGLVRADRVTSLILNDGRVHDAAARQAGEHDTLAAVLDNGTTAILTYCGTTLGGRAVADLAMTIGQAAQEAAGDSTVFVFARTAPGGGVSWHHSIDELDTDSWPTGPLPHRPLNATPSPTPSERRLRERQHQRPARPDDDDAPLYNDPLFDGPACNPGTRQPPK
ncbi:hypothetical protein [Nonomuraea sp. KM90]|uniref:hypothetical protein n=1 Tax=Nonomuraea sp. KM90 TaxID=3457428 RepID=UPI003FCE8131